MKVYLDNAATTKVDKEVVEAMIPYFSEKFGNASSLHKKGEEARKAVEDARGKIAKFLGANPEEIIFTSGGTESDNLAIKGLIHENKSKRHIITSKIEHPAILETCRFLEKKGYEVDYVSVNKEGVVNIEEIKKKIKKDTLLVSIMHVNNELGTIQPIEEIAELCRKQKVYFHTDAVQSFGKLKINLENIDLLSVSGHKINGPKGIGMLFVKKGVKISCIIHGGKHERGLRAGTENVPGIVGLGKAVELLDKKMKSAEKVRKLKNKLTEEILKIEGAGLNGGHEKRIFSNVNVSFKGVEGESLVLLLSKEGVEASTGSACSTHSLKPSHVLTALGLKEEEAHGSLRLTLGFDTTEEEIDYTIKKIKESVHKLRRIAG
ncbi:MAG: cysteine desulfurase NifS [archaeon]